MPLEDIESHSVLPDLIRKGGIVLDCGANLGAFSRAVIERFQCKVFAFEASPEVCSRISPMPGLIVVNTAICADDGPIELSIDDDITRTSMVAAAGRRTVSVPGRSLPSILAELQVSERIEVLKLDIEGAELPVLDSLPDHLLLRISQVTIEFHDFLGYCTTEEVQQRIDRLRALGFRELYWSRRRNTSDVLLVHSDRLSAARHAVEQHLIRPARALGRSLRRRLSS